MGQPGLSEGEDFSGRKDSSGGEEPHIVSPESVETGKQDDLQTCHGSQLTGEEESRTSSSSEPTDETQLIVHNPPESLTPLELLRAELQER